MSARARIILRCADGGTIGDVADELRVSRDMVSKWRGRFLRARLDGLTDAPRSGRPRTLTDDQITRVLRLTREQEPPAGHPRWTTRAMARASGVPPAAVARIWREHALPPSTVSAWTPPAQPTRHRHSIGGLLLAPSLAAVTLVLHPAPSPDRPARHLAPARSDAEATQEFRRRLPHLSHVLDLADRQRLPNQAPSPPPDTKAHEALRRMLDELDRACGPPAEVHVVADRAEAFSGPGLTGWMVRRPRLHAHVVPHRCDWAWFTLTCLAHLAARPEEGTARRDLLDLEAAAVRRAAPDAVTFCWTHPADYRRTNGTAIRRPTPQ